MIIIVKVIHERWKCDAYVSKELTLLSHSGSYLGKRKWASFMKVLPSKLNYAGDTDCVWWAVMVISDFRYAKLGSMSLHEVQVTSHGRKWIHLLVLDSFADYWLLFADCHLLIAFLLSPNYFSGVGSLLHPHPTLVLQDPTLHARMGRPLSSETFTMFDDDKDEILMTKMKYWWPKWYIDDKNDIVMMTGGHLARHSGLCRLCHSGHPHVHSTFRASSGSLSSSTSSSSS